jgi:hypothetical protein
MFDSEVKRLSWMIDAAQTQLTNATIRFDDTTDLAAFVVSSSWIDTALTFARSIHVLIESDLASGSGPLQRATWELWTDWKYLFMLPSRHDAAVKVQITAAIEAAEHAESLAHKLSSDDLMRARRALDSWRTEECQRPSNFPPGWPANNPPIGVGY